VEDITIRTPHLYHFDPKTVTQILEDAADTIDLKTLLELRDVSIILPPSISTSIGRALGAWLRAFHSWSSEPAEAGLRRDVNGNTPMRKTRYAISYGAFIDVVKRFPAIWKAKKTTLEHVRDMATMEYAKAPQDVAEADWGMIHGDFWTGK
jgi:hypothetical protein